MNNSYLEKQFNKKAEELELTDIEKYFSTSQEETSTLEFKSGDVEIFDIYKEICSFLNTEGGLLIIGAPRESKETKGKRTVAYCQGEITYSKIVSKDWLRQKIFSHITPSPVEIFIKEFSTDKGNIFILDIPQSLNPPHQSNADGRYYIRMDNEARPAPHGLVQALFDKRKKPILSARLNRKKISSKSDRIEVSINNQSNTPADKLGFIIDIYNIDKPEDKISFKEFKADVLGRKFTFSGKSDQILVSVISFGLDFTIFHLSKKYLITVNYWSKETDYDCTCFLIDPEKDEVISHHWLAEGNSIFEQLEKLKDK